MANSTDIRVLTDMDNALYHAGSSHVSRSAASRYFGADGGRSQRFVEVFGGSLFSGSVAASLGTAVDTAVSAMIGGVEWRSVIHVPPADVCATDGSRRGKKYTDWKSSLLTSAIEVSAVDEQKIHSMVQSLQEHKLARDLIALSTHSQYSVFWTDENGHQRKARADGVTATEWWDLKTTSSEWRDIGHSFRKYFYDWQAAWYSDAAEAAGCPPFVFRFVCVQTFPPFDVRVFTLPNRTLARARSEIDETLNAMRARRESGVYVDEQYHEAVELQIG